RMTEGRRRCNAVLRSGMHCRCLCLDLSSVVILGLDPRIHLLRPSCHEKNRAYIVSHERSRIMQRKPVHQANAEGAVLTKAAVRAADGLGLTARILSAVIGVSEATVSRLK